MGQEIVVRFSGARDAFAALYDIDSTGAVTLLFPNASAKNNRLQSGQIYSGDSWGLVASGTPGRERMFLLVALSNDQLPGVNAFVQDPSSSGQVSKSITAFARTVQAGAGTAPPGSFGASVVEFFTAK
jgi:hypothetical protein